MPRPEQYVYSRMLVFLMSVMLQNTSFPTIRLKWNGVGGVGNIDGVGGVGDIDGVLCGWSFIQKHPKPTSCHR